MPSQGVTRLYEASARTLGRTLQNLAFQDWVALAFHVYMTTRVLLAPPSPEAEVALRFSLALLSVTAVTALLTRGALLPAGRARALLYRLGIFLPLILSYFELRFLLPALDPHLLDPELWAIDRALLGTTPAVWMAQFNERPIVEWFAFFYYSYFYVLASVLLPSAFFDRGRRLASLFAGTMLVCALGHVIYTLVPGLGPYAEVDFEEPLRGGFFLGLVVSTVDRAGAMLDIFPSLHTAYPTFFAIFAFAERHRAPYKYVWPVLAFVALNIVIATMFLRWHWAIDVVAGLALAGGSFFAGRVVADREAVRNREDDPRQPVWEPVVGSASSPRT
jgi:hypothetical protein